MEGTHIDRGSATSEPLVAPRRSLRSAEMSVLDWRSVVRLRWSVGGGQGRTWAMSGSDPTLVAGTAVVGVGYGVETGESGGWTWLD